ncbi:MAG: FHIPEP family type III secretion protein [Thermoguttaceae bacterium]|nr:FHIPEP family type III secretion protein [Thermoguttaceae bacterium]
MNDRSGHFHWQGAALPFFATICILALLFRLPNGLMDLLLSINLALSATVFLSVFFVRKPLEFSSFPTILLTTTLFRLVLNVSTTRLILTKGDAGKVVDAFSRFMTGDYIVVGAVIFLIFIIVQFVVITKGATRISEVSARFTLDALPGRQSAIDFDLNAGNITEEEARAARAELSEQADFFGAMDGASKFVRGDAIAGLAIVAINVIGGLCIGVAQRHLSIGDAASIYTKLTIGDGLVSQIPAFLISLATGLLVARSSSSQNISESALRQTFGKPIVLSGVGFFLVVLAFTGLPVAPLLTLALGCFVLAWVLSRNADASERDVLGDEEKKERKKKNEDPDDVERFMTIDPMELEIGVGLVSIAQPDDGPSLLDRVRTVRQTIASELGLILPKVRVRDSEDLDENQFSIKIHGDEVALDVAYPQMTMAVSNAYVARPLRGLQTVAPGGALAYWIDSSQAAEAEKLGYTLLSAGDVVEKKTLEVARREAASLLTRDGAKRLIERLREYFPTLVEEVLGASGEDKSQESSARLAKIQKTLQLLLEEGVSIRRLDVVLEALGDLSIREPDADVYRSLEYVRSRLSRFLTAQYKDEDGKLRVAMLEPEAEDALRDALSAGGSDAPSLALEPKSAKALGSAIQESVHVLQDADLPQVVLVDGSIRRALRDAFLPVAPYATFLAYGEVDPNVSISQEVVVNWKP